MDANLPMYHWFRTSNDALCCFGEAIGVLEYYSVMYYERERKMRNSTGPHNSKNTGANFQIAVIFINRPNRPFEV